MSHAIPQHIIQTLKSDRCNSNVFRAYRKLTKGNCMRVFGEEQLLPADEAGTPQADTRIVVAREPPAMIPSHGSSRPRPLHTGAPGSRSQRRRVAASTTPSHGGSPTGAPTSVTAAPQYANPFGCSARTALAGLTASRLVSGLPPPTLSVLNQAKSRASPRQP